jgi:hypothetical protein
MSVSGGPEVTGPSNRTWQWDFLSGSRSRLTVSSEKRESRRNGVLGKQDRQVPVHQPIGGLSVAVDEVKKPIPLVGDPRLG